MTSLIIRDVKKSYGATPVLRGVDLTVETSTLTAILGASGVGKTTLLRVIGGFEFADGGSVTIDGTVVDDGRRALEACQYFGHDALLVVHPEAHNGNGSGELRARTDSPDPPEPGAVVSLDVAGCVAAWPAADR